MHANLFQAGIVVAMVAVGPVAAGVAKAESPRPVATLSVETVKPSKEVWPQTISASGWLAPWQEAVIASEAAGLRISDIHVDVGSEVRKGDVLAELSSEAILADIKKQEAEVDKAKANLEEADANLARSDQLKGTGVQSEQTRKQYLIAQRTAAATLASEQASLESEKIKLSQTKILAVDSGIISSRSAALGLVVSSGTELFRLIRQGRIEWQAEVPSQQVGSVRSGQAADVNLFDGQVLKGQVRLVSPTISKVSDRTVVFVSLLSSPPLSGQFAAGSIDIGEASVLAVPQSAIVQRDGMNYIFVLSDPSHVERRRVDTGRRWREMIEVKGEVDETTSVVKSGGAFLSDGGAVKVVSSPEANQ